MRRIINEMGSTNKCTRLMLISTILKLQNGGRGGQNFLIFFKDLNASHILDTVN